MKNGLVYYLGDFHNLRARKNRRLQAYIPASQKVRCLICRQTSKHVHRSYKTNIYIYTYIYIYIYVFAVDNVERRRLLKASFSFSLCKLTILSYYFSAVSQILTAGGKEENMLMCSAISCSSEPNTVL